MYLSTAGRILVIDDKFVEEAKPLLRVLSKNSLPYLYYEGLLKDMPSHPLTGIRFVFLDLDLKGAPKATGQDKIKNMASGAANILVKLISKKNGPFFILFWSNHSTDDGVIKLVLDNCATKGLYPVSYIDVDKPKCKNRKGNYDLKLITGSIESKISTIGSFMLYVTWENIINSSTTQQIFELFDSFQYQEDWNSKNELLFYLLYKTYTEGFIPNNDNQKIRNLYKMLGRALVSRIEIETERNKDYSLKFYNSEAISAEFFSKYLSPIKEVSSIYTKNEEENKYVLKNDVSKKKLLEGNKLIRAKLNEIVGGLNTIAKLNSSLFLSNCIQKIPAPGYVYSEQNAIILQDLKVNQKIDKPCKLCKIIITPECDIAQNKTLLHSLKKTEQKVHRIVYGTLIQIIDLKDYEDKNKSVEFLIGPFWYNDSINILIINFATLTFQEEGKFNKKPMFSLRRDLMFDLQSKAANHVNRLGNFQLK
jgi:hypothetical protein